MTIQPEFGTFLFDCIREKDQPFIAGWMGAYNNSNWIHITPVYIGFCRPQLPNSLLKHPDDKYVAIPFVKTMPIRTKKNQLLFYWANKFHRVFWSDVVNGWLFMFDHVISHNLPEIDITHANRRPHGKWNINAWGDL